MPSRTSFAGTTNPFALALLLCLSLAFPVSFAPPISQSGAVEGASSAVWTYGVGSMSLSSQRRFIGRKHHDRKKPRAEHFSKLSKSGIPGVPSGTSCAGTPTRLSKVNIPTLSSNSNMPSRNQLSGLTGYRFGHVTTQHPTRHTRRGEGATQHAKSSLGSSTPRVLLNSQSSINMARPDPGPRKSSQKLGFARKAALLRKQPWISLFSIAYCESAAFLELAGILHP